MRDYTPVFRENAGPSDYIKVFMKFINGLGSKFKEKEAFIAIGITIPFQDKGHRSAKKGKSVLQEQLNIARKMYTENQHLYKGKPNPMMVST